MRPAVWSTAAILALSSTGDAAAQKAEQDWVFGGVSFPPQVDTFLVQAANRWPGSPDTGVVLHYVSARERSARFDVYVEHVEGFVREALANVRVPSARSGS